MNTGRLTLRQRLVAGLLVGLWCSVLTLNTTAAERTLYWHYAPVAGDNTQALGWSSMRGEAIGPLQVRLLAGYELTSLGLSAQWQTQPFAEFPQWYWAMGVTGLQQFQRTINDDCVLLNCPTYRNSARAFGRWTWVKVIGDFRIDLGYGAELLWEFEHATSMTPRLNPAFDFTLGWAIF